MPLSEFRNIWECRLKKKKTILENQTSMCPRVYMIFAHDTRRQPGETRDPLTKTSQTAKKVRANEARHERPRLHKSIRGEASVSTYILALALSQVLSARVYSRHKSAR